MITVCHMTSAHSSNDERIWLKECYSLGHNGYKVYQVARGISETVDEVNNVGAGDPPKTRVGRMCFFTRKVYKLAKALDCDIYHFHDPELLPYGNRLARSGKIVIFDSHEDVPAQILDKEWLPKLFRKVISSLYRRYESYVVKRIDAVVTATPHIAEQFANRAKRVCVINNYPRLDDIIFQDRPFATRPEQIGYAGGLDEARGLNVLVEALKDIDGSFAFAGSCSDRELLDANEKVIDLGKISREEVNHLYSESRLGIILYQPRHNHYEARPIKLFEYMAAGLPFVAADYPVWKDFIQKNKCGVCVDVTDPKAVSKACNELLKNPQLAEEMGVNGREAIENEYSWRKEEERLLELYKDLRG